MPFPLRLHALWELLIEHVIGPLPVHLPLHLSPSQDLWDDENVIEPLPLNVKKDNNPSTLKAKAAEIAAAMSLQ